MEQDQSDGMDLHRKPHFESGKQNEPFTDMLNRKIPHFGLLMSLISVICFSLASLIVKILTEYHALEILCIRFAIVIIKINFHFNFILFIKDPYFKFFSI